MHLWPAGKLLLLGEQLPADGLAAGGELRLSGLIATFCSSAIVGRHFGSF